MLHVQQLFQTLGLHCELVKILALKDILFFILVEIETEIEAQIKIEIQIHVYIFIRLGYDIYSFIR